MPGLSLLNDIIGAEWNMFQNTQNNGGRASCQDDFDTFYAMRYGQFSAWSEEAALSYQEDLRRAEADGRNLVAEKYLRMMEGVYPEEYRRQAHLLPPVGPEKAALAAEINAAMVTQTEALRARYPRVSGHGRPLRSAEDAPGDFSVETYQRGELLTYSEKTLRALKLWLDTLWAEGFSLAERILANSVRYYGYDSLPQAEEALSAQKQ